MKYFPRQRGLRSVLLAVIFHIALGIALMGCARTKTAREVMINHSGFLPDISMLEPGEPGESLLNYVNPKVEWASYKKILIDPVLIWSRTDALPDATPKKDLQRLANNFYQMIISELGKDYVIVKEPEPRSLRVQVALTNIEQSTGAVDVTTAVIPADHVIFNAKDFVTGKPLLVGDVNTEYKVVDARTGQILSMGIDRKVGSRDIRKNLNSWNDANRILALWAKLVRFKLCKHRAGAGCVNPEY